MFIKNLAFGVRLITLFFLSSLAVLVIINIKRTENLDALRRTVDVENHESMYINIPKINLLMPLYLVDSSENNLDDGLMIYNYEPLVILGHSGTNLKNYFNNLKKSVASSLSLGIITAVILTFVSVVFLMPLLRMLNTPDNVKYQSYDYIKIIFLGMIISMLYS